MDESLYRELAQIMRQREWDRTGYIPADVCKSIVDDKIRRLLEWLADKSDELEGIHG